MLMENAGCMVLDDEALSEYFCYNVTGTCMGKDWRECAYIHLFITSSHSCLTHIDLELLRYHYMLNCASFITYLHSFFHIIKLLDECYRQ